MKAHLVFRLPLTAASTSTRLQQFVNSQQNAVKSSRNYLFLISKRKTITSVDYSKHNTRRSDTRKHQPPHNPVKLSTDHRLISEITGPLIGIWKWRGMWSRHYNLVACNFIQIEEVPSRLKSNMEAVKVHRQHQLMCLMRFVRLSDRSGTVGPCISHHCSPAPSPVSVTDNCGQLSTEQEFCGTRSTRAPNIHKRATVLQAGRGFVGNEVLVRVHAAVQQNNQKNRKLEKERSLQHSWNGSSFTPTTVTLGSDLPPRTRRERNVAPHLNAASWNQKRAVDTPVRKLSDMQSVM
ncbi:hypothetical protein DPX16_14044 [Anabarilius grahami]|uniref:Uncharacterized protein n=1 Tax=Anabarilius grahami TaxID=495550 RepID=A0A3N0Y909_ANAGA|nr:hypothetical protein DPX16_14044 [Anabarilius grahami]